MDAPLTVFQEVLICVIAFVAVARLNLWNREQLETSSGHICGDRHAGNPEHCGKCQNHEVI